MLESDQYINKDQTFQLEDNEEHSEKKSQTQDKPRGDQRIRMPASLSDIQNVFPTAASSVKWPELSSRQVLVEDWSHVHSVAASFGRSRFSQYYHFWPRRLMRSFEAITCRERKFSQKFSDRSFFKAPWGHGRPRLRVMDVRTEMLIFPGFRGPDRSFCPWTSGRISARTSAGYPAPKLTLWAAFSFLNMVRLRKGYKGHPNSTKTRQN